MLPRVQRLVARATALMALVVLAIHLRFSVPALMAGPWWSASADGASRGSLLGLLLWCVPIGRLVLSCFPPGEPGSHAPRNLAATLATSAVLGEIVLHLQGNLIGLIRWDAQPESLTVWVLLFGPWLVLAAVRLVTLPGAMVPRHAPIEPQRSPWLRWFAMLPWLVCLVLVLRDPSSRVLWEWLAFLVLLDHGLRVARRAPFGRAWLLLGAVLTVEPYAGADEVLSAAARLGIGAVFLVPWMRRADRRAGFLAALVFASLAWFEPMLALAGFAGLVLGAPARQRPFALACLVVGGVLMLMNKWLVIGSFTPGSWEEALQAAYSTQDWGLAWVFFTFCSLAGLGIFAGRLANAADRRGPWRPGSIEEPLHEVVVLACLGMLSYLALDLGRGRIAWPGNAPLVLFPIALLLFGLLLLPPARRPAEKLVPVASATGT